MLNAENQEAVKRLQMTIEWVKRPIVFFIGAGACHEDPKDAFPPSSLEISRYLLKELGIIKNGTDIIPPLPKCANDFAMVRGVVDLDATVSRFIRNRSQQIPRIHSLIMKILKLQFEIFSQNKRGKDSADNLLLVVTTNYDLLFERAFLQACLQSDLIGFTRIIQNLYDKDLLVYNYDLNKLSHKEISELKENLEKVDKLDDFISSKERMEKIPCQKVLNLTEMGKIILYKLHGSLDEPLTSIISENQYLEYIWKMLKEKNFLPKCLFEYFTRNPILFIGYSFQDWDMRIAYDYLIRQSDDLRNEIPRYAILFDPLTNQCDEINKKIYTKINWNDQSKIWSERGIGLLQCDGKDFLSELFRSFKMTVN